MERWRSPISSTELLHFILFHPVDLICIQESNHNSSFYFRISGFSALRSDRTHSRSGILSPDTTRASGGVILFVRQRLSFSKLSISSLSSFDPYSDYLGLTSHAYSLMFVLPLFSLLLRIAERTSFLPSPEISLFLRISNSNTPSGTQEVVPTPLVRKYSVGSSPLTSSLQ